MGIGTFELPKNQNSSYVDMSGWVNVEMPEEDGNRIGSKGLGRIDELASAARGEDPQAGRPADNRRLVDRMMAVAVRESDSAASAELLRTALKVKQDKKLTGELKELDLSRQAACNALKDLDSSTGDDLSAFAELSEDEWNETFARDWSAKKSDLNDVDRAKNARMAKVELVRAHLNDAVKAQEDYAKKLNDYCVNKGWLEGNPQREALLQLANRSLSRAEKIKELWAQLRAAKSAVGDNKFDQVLLNRRGFADRIYFDEAKHGDALRILRSNRTSPDEYHAAGVTNALMDEINKLSSASGSGLVQQKNVQTVAAHNFIDGLKLPEQLMKELNTCALSLELPHFSEAFAGLVRNSRLRDESGTAVTPESFQRALDAMPAAFVAFKESMRRYADVMLAAQSKEDVDVVTARDEMRERLAELEEVCAPVKAAVDSVKSAPESGNPYVPALKDIFANVFGFPPKWEQEVQNLKRICTFKDRENPVSVEMEDLFNLIEGTRRISPLIEAKVWGENGSHDPELKGLELVGVRELEHGSFNAVKLCTFVKNDGSTVQRVFRADNRARTNVANGAIHMFYSKCPEDVSGFSYSQASGEVASLFGCTDVFPKTTFGTLNGQPGMFMEVAPGKEGSLIPNCRLC